VVYTAFNIRVAPATSFIEADAGIAQLVERLICNQQVVGSNPTAGSLVNRGFAQMEKNCAWTLLGHFWHSNRSRRSATALERMAQLRFELNALLMDAAAAN
jgi:hypothetical protein